MALFLEKLYPDLFEGLTLEQVERLNNSWAAQNGMGKGLPRRSLPTQAD